VDKVQSSFLEQNATFSLENITTEMQSYTNLHDDKKHSVRSQPVHTLPTHLLLHGHHGLLLLELGLVGALQHGPHPFLTFQVL
jgi:hypothetical protein